MRIRVNRLANATKVILIAVALFFSQLIEAKEIENLQKTIELANTGDFQAQWDLICYYATTKNHNEEIKCLKKYIQVHNKPTEDDEVAYLAVSYAMLVQFAANEDRQAQLDLIDIYYNTENNYIEAIKWCELLIKNPNATDSDKGYAYLILGLCAKSGKGMQKSDLSNFLYWEAGANYNEDRCALYLANRFLKEKDTVNALRWYEKAADLKNVDATYFLGELYETGAAITPDRTDTALLRQDLLDKLKAKKYYEDYLKITLKKDKLKENHRSKVYYKLAHWYYSGESNIERIYTLAYDYFYKAIKENEKCKDENKLSAEEEGDALWHLSICYRFGRGVEKDDVKAQYYAKQAAEKGNEKAIAILNE